MIETPHDKLCAAIGILQAHILASDSMQDGPTAWGTAYFPASGVEHAIHLLIELLTDLEPTMRQINRQ